MPNATHQEHEPGTPAPETGRYYLLNVLGSHTGHSVDVEKGQPLPPAPREFRWKLRPESES